jgi:hypothetical protein
MEEIKGESYSDIPEKCPEYRSNVWPRLADRIDLDRDKL